VGAIVQVLGSTLPLRWTAREQLGERAHWEDLAGYLEKLLQAAAAEEAPAEVAARALPQQPRLSHVLVKSTDALLVAMLSQLAADATPLSATASPPPPQPHPPRPLPLPTRPRAPSACRQTQCARRRRHSRTRRASLTRLR
jgi:hypothetical protein